MHKIAVISGVLAAMNIGQEISLPHEELSLKPAKAPSQNHMLCIGVSWDN